MCKYTLAKFILLISLTFTSFSSMAGVGTNYNRKGVVINYNTPQASHVKYNSGETAQLSGSICVSKYSSIFNKLKCRATLQGNVSIRAYFPDAMTEVTDQLMVKKKGKVYEWSFDTPELTSGNENTLHILVAKDDLKIKRYERLQAKLNKRIVLLEKRIQQRNKRGSSELLIEWLIVLKERLERVSKNIDELIEEDASVLAQVKIPLQVDNDVAFPFYYSSFFSGHKMSLRAPVGSAIEGDKVTIEASTKNLTDKSFWFPGIDEKNDKIDESFNDDGLDQYNLDLFFNGNLKKSSGFSELPFGQKRSLTFISDRLKVSDLNNFELKLTKKLNHYFKFFKKKISLDFPYGEIGFSLPVSRDDVRPTISTDFFSEGEISLNKFENVKYLARDSFGHLLNDSIKIEIRNTQDEVVSGTSITSTRINKEEVEYNVSNLNLSDGSYQIMALIRDNAGNESTKLVNKFFIDNSVPTLFENNTPNGFIAGDKLDLDFKVSDLSSVEVIVFSNGDKLLTTSNKHVQESITLSSGENIISAKLTDSLGNTETVEITTVSIDNIAPTLANNKTSSGYTANSSLTLNFSISDISTVTTEVFNNGTKVLTTTNKNVNESISLSDGSNNISIVMTDAAGNVSNADVSSVILDNVSPILLRNANSDSVLSTSSYTLDFTVQDSTPVTTSVFNNGTKILETSKNLINNSINLNYGVNEITIFMSDSAGNTSSANIAKLTLDNKKPVLAQNNTEGGLTVNKTIPLDFSIEDLSAVDIKVFRNGIEVLSSIEKVIKTSIELVEGSNEITATVLDQAENTESFTIAQVIYDGTKPSISSINLIDGQSLDSLTYELKGVVSEELNSLSVNGDSVSLNEKSFSYTISNTQEGAKAVVIAMADLAGNTNEFTINYAVQLAPEEFECIKQEFSEDASCSEVFVAQSLSDVESYKSSSDVSSKNLALAFSYSGDEHLIVHTPCSINVAENFNFSTTGGVCLDSRDGLNIQTQSLLSANEVNLFSDTLINIEENAALSSVESFTASSPECTFENTTLTGSGNCFDPSRPVVKVSTTKTNLEIGETLSFSTSESIVPNGISTVEYFINELKQENSANSFNHTFNEEGIFYVKAKITDSNGYISSSKIKINVSAPIINTREAFFKYAVEDEMLELIFVQSIPRDQIKTAKFIVDGQDYVLPNYYHLDSIYINDISLGNHDVILEVTDSYDQVFKYQRSVFVGTNEEMAQLPPVMEFEVVPSAPRKVFIEFRDVFDPAKLFDGLVIDWGDGQKSEHWIPDEGGVKHQYASAGTYEVSVEFVKYGDEELVTTLAKEVIVTDDEVSPAPPIVNFRYEKQYFAPHVTFNVDLSMSPTGEIVSRTFDYGDGTVYTGNEPIHTHFYEPGTYYPTLTIVDEYGMTTSQTARVFITEEGEDFISHLECFDEGGLYVGCDVVALSKDEEIQSIEIDWGDGNTETFDPAFSSWTWDFFEHEYEERDNYVVKYIVYSGYGEKEISLPIYLKGEKLSPEIFCVNKSLNIECRISDLSDVNATDFQWKLNGDYISNLKDFTQSLSEHGSHKLDVSFIVDGILYSLTKRIVVSDEDTQLFNASLICINSTSFKFKCSISGDTDIIESYKWYLNDELVESSDRYIILSLNEGSYDIEVEAISSNYRFYDSAKLFVDYVKPEVELVATLNNDGNVDVHARKTADGIITKYAWTIDDKPKVYTVSNQVTFGYDYLNQKTLKLTFTDDLGIEYEEELYVDFSSINRKPVIDVEVFRPNGKAGRLVEFDGSGTHDPNNDEFSFNWMVDGVTYSNSRFSHLFSSRGRKDVVLKVEDSKGLVSIKRFSLVIEDINIYESPRKLSFISPIALTFKNFKLEDEGYAVYLNDVELDSYKVSADTVGFIPAYTKAEDSVLTIVVDNSTLSYDVSLNEIINLERPSVAADIAFKKYRNSIISQLPDDDDTEKFFEMFLAKIDTAMSDLSDDDLKMFAIVFNGYADSFNRLAPENNKVTSLFHDVINIALPQNVYALTDVDVYNEAQSCSRWLVLNGGFGALVGGVSKGISIATLFTVLNAPSTASVTGKFLAIAGVAASISKIVQMISLKYLVKKCIVNVKYPNVINDEYLDLRVNNIDASRNEVGAYEVYNGRGLRVDIIMEVQGYHDYKEDVLRGRVENPHTIFKQVDGSVDYGEGFVEEYLGSLNIVMDSIGMMDASLVGLVTNIIEFLMAQSFITQLETEVAHIRGDKSLSESTMIDVLSDKLLTIGVEGRLRSEIKVEHSAGNIIFNLANDEEVPENFSLKTQSRFTDLFNFEETKSISEYRFQFKSECGDKPVYGNKYGGYFESLENVEYTELITNGGIVCDGAKVKGGVKVTNGARVFGDNTKITNLYPFSDFSLHQNVMIIAGEGVSIGNATDETVDIVQWVGSPGVVMGYEIPEYIGGYTPNIVISGNTDISFTKALSMSHLTSTYMFDGNMELVNAKIKDSSILAYNEAKTIINRGQVVDSLLGDVSFNIDGSSSIIGCSFPSRYSPLEPESSVFNLESSNLNCSSMNNNMIISGPASIKLKNSTLNMNDVLHAQASHPFRVYVEHGASHGTFEISDSVLEGPNIEVQFREGDSLDSLKIKSCTSCVNPFFLYSSRSDDLAIKSIKNYVIENTIIFNSLIQNSSVKGSSIIESNISNALVTNLNSNTSQVITYLNKEVDFSGASIKNNSLVLLLDGEFSSSSVIDNSTVHVNKLTMGSNASIINQSSLAGDSSLSSPAVDSIVLPYNTMIDNSAVSLKADINTNVTILRSTVKDNAVIGEKANLEDSFVDKDAKIGSNVKGIKTGFGKGVEIKNNNSFVKSVIEDGAIVETGGNFLSSGIGENSNVGDSAEFQATYIENNVKVRSGSHFVLSTVGEDSIIGSGVTLDESDLGKDVTVEVGADIKRSGVGNNGFVGAGATLLDSVIGENSGVNAGSNVVSTTVYGGAFVDDKDSKVCDNFEDTLPDDPCMSNE
ncbi:PKD domain-containing protein [Halobacteriovorax sp. YZS-1-1]|uniref:PKD domain-containing protein n=1 Tax=unclassified Halobacteriovorax TaxID=2639665 RepID=UPI00399BDC30